MLKSSVILRLIDVREENAEIFVTGYTQDSEYYFLWPHDDKDTKPKIGDIYKTSLPLNTKGPFHKIGQTSREDGSIPVQSDVLRWRKRQADGKTRMELLHKRATIRRAVRHFMDESGFLEIDIPLLVHGVIPDAALHSFSIEDRFLVTTTENQLKRMETGGFDRIYSLTKNFREGDTTSPYRNPEFTMLEWARVGESYDIVEQDAENIVLAAHQSLGGTGQIIYQGHKIDLSQPWERLSVKDAVKRYTGYHLRDFSHRSLLEALAAASIEIRANWEEDRVFLCSLLMDHIQQFLGFKHPVLLQDWPAFQTSMALEKDDGETAYRSEVYIAGIELSDGFPALTSYARQKETFQRQIDRRREEGLAPPVVDDAYLEALRDGLPQESSMAMGFDRLVMLLTDQANIRSVLAFGWDEV